MCGIDLLADSVPPSAVAIPPPPASEDGGIPRVFVENRSNGWCLESRGYKQSFTDLVALQFSLIKNMAAAQIEEDLYQETLRISQEIKAEIERKVETEPQYEVVKEFVLYRFVFPYGDAWESGYSLEYEPDEFGFIRLYNVATEVCINYKLNCPYVVESCGLIEQVRDLPEELRLRRFIYLPGISCEDCEDLYFRKAEKAYDCFVGWAPKLSFLQWAAPGCIELSAAE